MATSSFFYNGSTAPEDNPNTPTETTGSGENTVKTSFFYEGISPPSQTSVAELLADLDEKLAAAQAASNAAILAANTAQVAANNADASEAVIESLLSQANSALVLAQQAQAAANTALNLAQNSATTTAQNAAIAQAAQAICEVDAAIAQAAANSPYVINVGSDLAGHGFNYDLGLVSDSVTITPVSTPKGYIQTVAESISDVRTAATNMAAIVAAPSAAASAAASATAAAASATSIAGLIPSQTGNNGKFLKTNGTTTSWATVDAFPNQSGNTGKFLTTNGTTVSWAAVSVAPATPSVRGMVFGATDSMTYALPSTIAYNSFIMTQSIDGTPINTISGNSASAYGANAYVIAQAIINSQIQVGQNLKLVCQVEATGLQTLVDLGTITSATYGVSISGSWTYDISYTNPYGWTGEGLTYDYRKGIHVYDFVIGGTPAENVLLGYQAGAGITTGGENVVIGANAGSDLRSGRNNVVIGNAAQGSSADVSNEITLGNSLHTKTRLFGSLALNGSSEGAAGQFLTSQGPGVAPTWTSTSGVTSVNLSVPTGLSVSGGPIVSSGTLAVTYATGYSIPTTASQANWDTAYGWGNHASAGYVSTSGTYANPSWITSLAYSKLTGAPTAVSSFTNDANYITTAGARSAISVSGSLSYNSTTGVISYTTPSTSGITEGTNLYYTDARARAAISAGTGISYNSTTGAVSSTITQYTDALARAAISATGSLSYNSTTGVISYTQPTYATVATSGSYTDLSNKPTIDTLVPTQTGNSGKYLTTNGTATSWGALATVATTGAYNDLTGKPTLGTAAAAATTDFLAANNPSYTGTLTGGTGVINIGSNQIYKDASGNIGFGTSTMVAKLNVAQTYDSVLIQATNGTVGHRVSYILSNVAYTGTSNAYPLALMTVGTEAMRIDTSQRVGIGTTSTLGNSLLNVAQGVVARNASTTLPYFQTYNSNAGTDLKTWRVGGDNSGNWIWQTVNDAYSSATERMRIDASGNATVSGTVTATGGNSTNWNTAYGWGNHASAGYLTSSTAASTYVSLSGSYANPSWITSLAGSKLTSNSVDVGQLASILDLGVLP